LVAACNKDTAQQKPPQPAVHTQINRVVQLRDPKKDHGETQRIITRDALGRQTITIDFQDRSTGTIQKDEAGKTISIEVHRTNGTVISGSPDESGRAIGQGTVRAPDGALIVSRQKSGDTTEVTFYQTDGKTVRLYEKYTKDHVSRKLFSDDGATVFEEELEHNVRVALNLYSSGKLVYNEHVTTPNPHFGGMNMYAGTVYNLDGKATHRVTLGEGPFDNGAGRPRQIDTLADDGQTVTATANVNPWSEEKVPLGFFGDQINFIKTKRDFWITVNKERARQIPLDSTLSPLLYDGKV